MNVEMYPNPANDQVVLDIPGGLWRVCASKMPPAGGVYSVTNIQSRHVVSTAGLDGRPVPSGPPD